MLTITPDIHFVGVEDDNIDLFEGQYPLTQGISYNSYLISDECVAVVDTVDRRRCIEWLEAVEHALDGRKPDYLIVQHVEPDHSGSIDMFVQRYPEAKIVATAKAIDMIANFFESVDLSGRTVAVGDNDTLCLGMHTLNFITAPMVHWPEVMMTLDTTDGVLFSADAFGSFATYSSPEAWNDEARRYYCNIVGKYGANVQSVMKKLTGRIFRIVAPLHGPVLSENLAHYWKLYDQWSRYEPETRGVLVAYASIYGGTAQAARRLAAMLEEENAGEVVQLDLCRHDVSYAVAQAFRLSHMVLCSVTYDGDVFPAMHTFLHHIAAKNLRNRAVAIVENGSWAPLAAKRMTETVSAMRNMTIVSPTVTLHSRLHHDDLAGLRTLAHNLATTIHEA